MKKEQVYQYIRKDTLAKIKAQNYKNLGIDALTASLDLKTDRSNISRLLNQLYNDGSVIKTSSRPILFMDRAALEQCVKNIYIPSVIPKGQSIEEYLSYIPDTEDVPEVKNDAFHLYITNLRHSKMSDPVKHAKASLLYPAGLNTIIIGEKGTGRLQFAKAMENYAKEIHFIDEKQKTYIVECLNYSIDNKENFLKLLFGEYISQSNTYKRGLLQQTQNNIVILNNLDRLPAAALSSLYNAILSRAFSPINSKNTFELKSLIIATSTKSILKDDHDIRRCFPMLINFPGLQERSAIEKLALILHYLQNESVLIDKTIRISQNALRCFIMSNYEGELAHLRAEIRQACAMGYQKLLNKKRSFVDIGLDEISSPVLEKHSITDTEMTELNNTLKLFTNDYLFFSPRKKSPELMLLYDLNQTSESSEIVALQNAEGTLVNQCITDIDSAINISQDTIHTMLPQKIFDFVYPQIKNHPICKNDNLLYGLLLHISDKLNSASSKHAANDIDISELYDQLPKADDYAYAIKIIHAIQNEYNFHFPKSEIDYIATYLYLSSQWINKCYIQLLIISSNTETAKNYANFINGQNFKTYASYVSVSPNEDIADVMHSVSEKMKEIDRGHGIIIVTDYPPVKNNTNLIATNFQGDFTITDEMSLPKILSIAEQIDSLAVSLRPTNASENFAVANRTAPKKALIDNHTQELLEDIQNKLLAESLVFLNPQKVCQALFDILLNILNDLSIPYSDDLLIKFITHTSFALERCIRKEPFAYPKSYSFIKQNRKLFNVLAKNLGIITEIFSVQIPASEMGFIIELFLLYYQK